MKNELLSVQEFLDARTALSELIERIRPTGSNGKVATLHSAFMAYLGRNATRYYNTVTVVTSALKPDNLDPKIRLKYALQSPLVGIDLRAAMPEILTTALG